MPLPVAKVYSRMTGLIKNNNLKGVWKKGLVLSYDVYIMLAFGQTGEDHKNLQS